MRRGSLFIPLPLLLAGCAAGQVKPVAVPAVDAPAALVRPVSAVTHTDCAVLELLATSPPLLGRWGVSIATPKL